MATISIRYIPHSILCLGMLVLPMSRQAMADDDAKEPKTARPLYVVPVPHRSSLDQSPTAGFLSHGIPVEHSETLEGEFDNPLSGSSVYLLPLVNNNRRVINPIRPATIEPASTVKTDPNGAYQFREAQVPLMRCDPQRHSAIGIAMASGYAIEAFDIESAAAVPPVVTMGWSRPVKLSKAVPLNGRVVDEHGVPVADAAVILDMLFDSGKRLDFISISLPGIVNLSGYTMQPRTITDAEGNFTLTGMKPGSTALVRVVHPDFAPTVQFQPVDASSPKLRPNGNFGGEYLRRWENHGEDIRLDRGIPFQFRCVDKVSGSLLKGLEVCVFEHGIVERSDKNGMIWTRIRQWPEGEFGPTNIFSRFEYRLPDDPMWTTATITQDDADAGFKVLEIEPAKRCFGKVSDAETGQGIGGVVVKLDPVHLPVSTVTDHDGHYEMLFRQRVSNKLRVVVSGPVFGYDLPVEATLASRTEPITPVDPERHSAPIPLDASGAIDQSRPIDFRVQTLRPLEVMVVNQQEEKIAARLSIIRSRYKSHFDQGEYDGERNLAFPVDRPLDGLLFAETKDGECGITMLLGTPKQIPETIVVSYEPQFDARVADLLVQLNLRERAPLIRRQRN